MTIDLIISIILLGLSLFILLWFFTSIFFTSGKELLTFRLKTSLKKKVANLEMAAKLQSQGNYSDALAEIKLSFILDTGPWSHPFIEQVTNHHMNALSQILSMAEKLDQQLTDLPIAEGLLLARSDLLKSFSDASKSADYIRKKLKERGSEQQNWAYAEAARKIDELKDKLATNKRTILSKYDEIAKTLTNTSSNNVDFTYH